jgi:putative FmdB family regulatory protein
VTRTTAGASFAVLRFVCEADGTRSWADLGVQLSVWGRVAGVRTRARTNVRLEAHAMPNYEFRCKKCGTVFERQEHIAEHQTSHPPCPKCNSKAVESVLADFYAVTSKKS